MTVETNLLLRIPLVAFVSVLLLLLTTVSSIISLLLLPAASRPSGVADVRDEQRSEAVAELDVPAEDDSPSSGPQRAGGKSVSTDTTPLTCIFWGHWEI